MHHRRLTLLLHVAALFLLAAVAVLTCETGSFAHSEIKSLDSPFSLGGGWKIMLGDDPQYASPGYDDSSWDAISLPGSMMPYILSKSSIPQGSLWVRKTIHVDKGLEGMDIGLILGRISNADETFVNGVRVGSTGGFPPDAHSMWYHPRYYPVAHPLVRYGADNVIAIRISYYLFCDITGTMAVANVKEWKADMIRDTFLFIDFSYIVISIGLTLLVITIFIYIFRPGSQEYLYYCLQLLCAFFMVMEVCTYWNLYGSMEMRFKILGIAWAAVNVTHPIFLHRLYDFSRKKVETILWIYLAAVVAFAFVVTGAPLIRISAIVLILATQIIGFYNISIHVSALVKKHPYARIFGFFGIVLVMGAIHDGLAYLAKCSAYDPGRIGDFFSFMVLPYAAVLLYVGSALVLAVRFVRILSEVKDLNVNLERKVDERTGQLMRLTDELEKKNKILSEVALRDSLTGLYNHAAFHERLLELLNESKRHAFAMCVVMIDIDDFKVFNDTYGHQVGDEILLRIADIFKSGLREYDAVSKFMDDDAGKVSQAIRNYDLVGRYGGDEFVLVLPYCGEEEALVVAERTCRSIEAIRLKNHPELKITGSFGLAMLDECTECRDSKELIALADKALYRAKSEGKNRICYLKYA